MAAGNRHQPNIIVILADDHGAWALGSYGNLEIHTPHLDRLAADGMRFTNYFCTSPVCSPARASLLTGKIPSQHGVHDWIREGNAGERAVDYLEGHVAYTEILARQGYVCGINGKWHLGDSMNPQKGFSHWYVHEKGGGPYYGAPMIRDGQKVIEPEYITKAITDDALAFLRRQQSSDRPFYQSIHYTAPHDPWINSHPQSFVDLYRDCEFRFSPQEPLQSWFKPKMLIEDIRANLAGYYAAITAMDEQIGRIISYLEQEGLRENTLVCFLSDNGFNCGHHGVWGKGNGTFPLNMYDTSVKVPCIMSQPGRIPMNAVCDSLLSGYDFMPTLLEYVNLEQQIPAGLPGKSYVGLLEGTPAEEQKHIVVYDEYGPVRMIRTKEWKYIHRYPYGPHELYDLEHDPGERRNIIEDSRYHPILTALRASLHEWFIKHADPDADGSRQPVMGEGQTFLVGERAKGKSSFAG